MYQNCIVPSSTPGFSYLTEHYNVSDDTLKNIIYKYRIETKDPEAVPTDVYVQAQLGMTQYMDASPMAKQVWEKFYKSPKEFSSKEEFGKAKEEALTMFPTEAVKVYTNSKGHYVLAVREPVTKFEPKHRKDFSSWAEYNDYLLAMGELIPENERDVEKQVIGNQPFTFRDGTTVTVPFKPNSQQEEALNEINDFLKSNETAMTLSGYAGTGKTSLMEVIAQKAKKDGRNIVFSASTNKAAAVLRDRVKSAGFTAQTLNKVFGIQVEVDSKKPYDANNLVNRLSEAKALPGSVVVIDEASMINEENYKILNKIAEDNGLQIIYVRDKGQLAPVNEEKVSKVFRNNEGRVATLTKVERTDDNAILKEATNIRNGKPLSGESSFNKDGKGVAYVKKTNKEAIKDIVERFVPMLRTNPDYFRILAYTNAAVAKYNEAVRRTLGYTDNAPRVNEPIVGYSNWGYTWDRNGGTYKFINSEAYKVTKVGSPKTITRTVGNTAVSLTAIPVTIQDNMGNDQKVDFIDIKGNEENKKGALILAKEKARLKNEAWKLAKSSPRRAEMLQAANAIEEFLFVNDDIIDTESTNASGKHPTLQKKVFDFGYAMTVHKSQGSTFTHVLMDDADIATAKNNRSSWSNMSLDEGSGEVHEIDNIEIKESGNLFELVNNPDAAQAAVVDALNAVPSEESNNTNIRQQLEYVAVSRATDTVTVIANDGMVKKEDTPLNHLPQSKEAITKDITQQTLNQLEEIFKMAGGVEYENEIAKFLEKNPQWSSKIQMFIGKKARTQFEQQLMKARPDLATPAYNINGINFIKDPFSDDYIPNRMDAATARKLQEEGIIKEGVFSPWALTDEGKAKSQTTHPELDSVLDFLHSLEDNKENTAYIKTAIRWIANRSITLPQDNVKARQAFDLARKKHLDLQKYSTLGELITAPEMQPKEKEKKSFDPDKTKTFSGKRTVTTEGGRVFTVYDVENTEKGQRDVCKALAAHYEMSPWCLSTFTATGEPTESAKHFWEHYNAIPRKIAYENGKPVAFSSSDTPVHDEAWWDMQDVAPQRSLSDAIVVDSKAKYAAELEGFDWDAFAVPEPTEPSPVERARDEFIFQLRDAVLEVVNEVADAQGIGQNYAVRQEVVDMYLRSMNFSINEVTQEMAEGDGRALADLLNQHVNDAFRYNVEQTIGQYYSLAEENRNTQPIAPIVEEDDILPFYKTSLGEVYGFIDSLDNMYLDRNVITAEHGIHEYTHIWDRYVAKRNPELWNTGVSIMKKTALWQEILNDENYGKAWQSMRGMTPEKLENLVASEVHSRLTGKRGKEIMDNLAKKKGAKKIIAQLKQWLVDFWTELKSAFTPWTDQELQALKDLAEKDIDKAIQMLSDMTLKDFTEGVNPILQEMQEVPGRVTKKQIDRAKDLLKNKIEHLQGQIEWIEERQKWNKATQKQLEELASLRQEISEEQALYDGLKTGESEVFINEHDVPQIRRVQQSAQQTTQQAAQQSNINERINKATQKHQGNWSRQEAQNNPRILYVFTDNTDRDSGRGLIPNDSWYSKKYGIGHHFPTMTAAVVRGLDNARPISTQRWYHQGAKGNTGRWTDVSVDEFKRVIRAELQDIIDEFNTGKYDTIMFPDGDGLFNTSISNITKARTPQLYKALADLLHEYGFDSLIPSDVQPSQNIQQPVQQAPTPNTPVSSNFRTYGDAYTTVERDDLIQELLDDGYSREDIQVEHIPATETEDDVYLVKVRDNSQAMVNAITSSTAFVPHPIQLSNLGAETGERLMQVDQAWKEPILLDLDSQLGMDISEEEKAKIIQQMYRVKDAVSEEEYNKAPTAERQEVNDKMEDYWRRNNQMNALMENEVGLTPTEIREVSMQIVDSISDIISEIQANPEKAKDYFPSFSSTIDLKNATRKKIVEAVDINNLIKEAKRRFENIRYDESNSEAYDLYDSSFELLDQADLILENWETIMELAADEFLANEGFSIQRDTKGKRFKTQEREFTGYDYDNYVDPQDEQAIAEEGDEQEHWQVITRTIDAFNSMSDKVRLAYHNCYELDKDGNKILSKWGIPKRVNKVKAVSQTLRWTQGTLNIYEMIDALKKKEPRNPWLNQLINRLSDTSGKESDFQSQFYGVMHRHFQLYSIGQLENGVYASKTLNAHVALSDIMKSINAKYQMKSHPLFNGDGSVKAAELNKLRQNNATLKQMISKYGIRFENGEYSAKEPFSQEDLETIAKTVAEVSKAFGYTTSDNAVQNIITAESLYNMQNKLNFAIGNLEKAGKDYDPFNFEVEGNIRSEVMGFLTPIVEELEDAATNAFFDNGNMYQSYVIPSFLTQLFDSFKQPSEQFHKWVESFYGQSEWFKDKDGRWRLPWLERLIADPKARELLDHKVQLNFNKHDYMRNMSPEEHTLSVFMEYFSERLNMKDLRYTPAWFRVPIQSNKPSSEFVKFYADRSPAYKENITKNLYSMFLQEVSRIDTVRKRNKQKGDYDYIASWDEQGRKFVFLPFLNSYLMDNGKLVDENDRGLFRKEDGTLDNEKSKKLKDLLNKKVKAEETLSEEEEAELMNLVQEATRNAMQIRVDNILNRWEKTGILKAAEKIKGIKSLNHNVRENLENFLWNDFYAANSILQMTIVDKAFYPHATELQKRLAELHAPGTRGNKFATDYKGNLVSDGFYRTLLLTEFDTFVANIIDNITAVFNKKIANAPDDEKAGLEALKESLVGEKGVYRNIEVTNAQGYSSPSSYRKKAFMFGKWSQQAEDIYQRLLKKDYTLTDLEVAFQPLKPFVYGHLSKNTGVGNAPITKMPVPFQAKNAEYLLIMADALTRGEETGRPNLLRAIYDIMEQSEKLNPTMGIDTVQFTSAIKSGEQGSIDIAPFLTMEGGEEGARTLMEKLIYQDAVNEDGTKYNYDSFIHKTDYDNYAIQQEVPPHFMDHSQAESSQQRMNTPADLDFYDYDGNENYYSWKDPDGTEHKMNAKEFRKEYERVHAANIEDSFNKLTKELHLDSNDKRARNLALSEILQDEIMSSPRYGISLFLACQIDPATGEFRIPKGDPIQAKRIEQLVNSIIKNRVNKQKIAGGPIVQVSNFGTSRQLHIKFHDKKGNILMTREEYEKTNPQESFEEYLKKNQAGVAHFEIFAPIGMKSLFEKFKNPDGTINLEAVEKCDPELLKVITGRIPNEDKYSIAHGKIVGFMPALAGDAIMFPWELTRIDDSDFDVDKRYTQRKVMNIVVDWSKVKDGLVKAAMKGLKAFQESNPVGYEKWAKKKRWGQSDRDAIMEQVEMFMDNPEQMKDTDALMASMYKEYERILREDFPYKTVYPKKGTRDANNNQIIDMQWAVMSNEMTADKLLNPGGFEIPKHQAYVIAAYRNSNGTISWETLEGMTTKQLKNLATREMDLAWFDDHVQFYKQNAAGSNLIGVFAVNKVAHATLEGDGLLINVADFCGEQPFTICDMVFEGMMAVDPTKDAKNMLIGKNIGSGIGASADTAKDPWLDSINVNMTTAGMFNALIRMGMPMEDAELFMAQDVIGRLMDEFNRKSLEEKTSIDQIIQEKIDVIKKKHGYTDDSEINLQPLTREELKKGILPAGDVISEDRETIDYKTLLAFQKAKTLAKAIRKPTFVTRLNSISAAVGPLIIDNIILEHKLFEFLQANSDENTGFYVRNEDGTFSSVDMDDILFEHPILKQFSRPADSRNPDCPTRILFSDMPAGSSLFKSVLKALPSNISDKIYDDRQLLGKLSDFFQSYLLVANDVIDTKELKYFIEEFPKDFIGTNEKKGLQEKYPDNAFVQAIQLDYDKKSKRAYLNVNTTGMKEQEKERLRMAWADLHKVDPELSTKLFTYAFFRGGIGFSPRTFMGLADYIKENIEGYVDTYRYFPRMDEQAMIEQFVRNNWENNTLAPMKGGENTKYDMDLENGTLFVRDEKDMADLKGVRFFKTKDDKHTYLWKLLGNEGANKYERQYVRVDPLGNNGEYVEISRERNMQAFDKTAVLENRNETQELPESSPMETEASDADTPTTMPESESQQAKNVGMLVPYVMKQNPRATQESAAKQMQAYKDLALNNKLTSGHKAYLVNLFKQAGLVLTQEEAAEKFKEFC